MPTYRVSSHAIPCSSRRLWAKATSLSTTTCGSENVCARAHTSSSVLHKERDVTCVSCVECAKRVFMWEANHLFHQHAIQVNTRRVIFLSQTFTAVCLLRCLARASLSISESSAFQRTSGDRCFGRGSCIGLPIRCPVDPSSTPALILVPPISSPTKSMLSSNIATSTAT